MSTQEVTENDVISWAVKALEKLNLTDCAASVAGRTGKGDGYSGEVIFVNGSGTTKGNNKITIDLAVKHGKSSQIARRKVPVKEIFETEIKIYDKVFPAFEKFQLKKKILDVFDAVPRCHLTLILDQMEVLVLDNLKRYGYELHERKKALNFSHLKLVLKEYGKLHALSFALKDQDIEEFKRISDLDSNTSLKFLGDDSVKEQIESASRYAISILRDKGHESLCKKYESVLVKGAGEMVLNFLKETGDQQQKVIVHGDCWNNNFMFKYEVKL